MFVNSALQLILLITARTDCRNISKIFWQETWWSRNFNHDEKQFQTFEWEQVAICQTHRYSWENPGPSTSTTFPENIETREPG